MSKNPAPPIVVPAEASMEQGAPPHHATVAGLERSAVLAVEEARQARFQMAAERAAGSPGRLRRWLRALRG